MFLLTTPTKILFWLEKKTSRKSRVMANLDLSKDFQKVVIKEEKLQSVFVTRLI